MTLLGDTSATRWRRSSSATAVAAADLRDPTRRARGSCDGASPSAGRITRRMACFLACFAGDSSKARKRRREVAPPRVPARPPSISSVRVHLQSQEIGEFSQRIAPEKPPANVVAALSDPVPSGRKRVTFDLNVKTYENIPSSISEDSKYSSDEEAESAAEDKDEEKTDRDEEGDDDIGGGEDIGIDDDEYGDSISDDGAREVSYDSYFSLPLDMNRNGGCSKDFSSALVGSEEVNSSPSSPFKASRGARDRSKYVHSVLNPIENSAQWKEVTEARMAPEKRPEEKENIGLAPETDPLIPCMDSKKDVAVDASLSSWLVTSAIHAN